MTNGSSLPWPRGPKKQDARIDARRREIPPWAELHRWYGHDPEKWDKFRRRYFAERDAKSDPVRVNLKRAQSETVTLLFGARERGHNDVVAVEAYLEAQTWY